MEDFLSQPFDPNSEFQAFINAIIASPEDDAPRLIFADWLDETPQYEEYARYIRLSVQAAHVRKFDGKVELDALHLKFAKHFLKNLKLPCDMSVHREEHPITKDSQTTIYRDRTRLLFPPQHGFRDNEEEEPTPGGMFPPLDHLSVYIGTYKGFIRAVVCTEHQWLNGVGLLVCNHPVQLVCLRDKLPYRAVDATTETGRRVGWFRSSGMLNMGGLNPRIFDFVASHTHWQNFSEHTSMLMFKSMNLAYVALREGCLEWAREGTHWKQNSYSDWERTGTFPYPPSNEDSPTPASTDLD